ncbi:unnamed protein product [Gadus morhua 'NCC']
MTIESASAAGIAFQDALMYTTPVQPAQYKLNSVLSLAGMKERTDQCHSAANIVVCQACSSNKFYLEYLKNQPARVCDHCFTKLQENSQCLRTVMRIGSRKARQADPRPPLLLKVSKPSLEAIQNELNIEGVECSFILSASSSREHWLEAIAKAIDDSTKKKVTFVSSRSQDENGPRPCVVFLPGAGRGSRHRGSAGFQSPRLDPRPAGHHVHDVHL